MKTAKRITSLIIALAMCLSMLSVGVQATDQPMESVVVDVQTADESNSSISEEAESQAEIDDSHEDAISMKSASEPEESIATQGEVQSTMQNIVDSGTCGENLTWILDQEGMLTISGTGEMDGYILNGKNEPWWKNRDKIKSVIIGDGVTSIGACTFMNAVNLVSVTIPDSVTGIGDSAFSGCSSLPSIVLPDSLTSIGELAFANCSSLASLTSPGTVANIGADAFYGCTSLPQDSIPRIPGGDDSGSGGDTGSGTGDKEVTDSLADSDDTSDDDSVRELSLRPVSRIELKGHLYCLYDDNLKWGEAKKFCEQHGGHLVTITSAGEQNAMQELINGGNMRQYWIGMSRIHNTMTWVTGESVTYTNWDQGEPNNCHRKDGQNEDYVHIYNVRNPVIRGSERFCWNDMFYDNTYPGEEQNFSLKHVGFICEWDSTLSINLDDSTGVAQEYIPVEGIIESPRSLSDQIISWFVEKNDESYNSFVSERTRLSSLGNNQFKISSAIHYDEPGIYYVTSAVNDTMLGEASDTCRVIVKPARVEDFIVSASDREEVFLEWPEMKGVDGFTVEYCVDGNFTKFKSFDVDISRITVDNNERTMKYSWKNKYSKVPFFYVRIAAYIEDNDRKIQGEWTEVDENTKAIFTFNADRDGWCVPNEKQSFGDDSYRFTDRSFNTYFSRVQPLKGFSYVLTHLTFIAEDFANTEYTGSCHGMALLSAGNYLGKVDLRETFGKDGLGLSEYGQTGVFSIKDNGDDANCFTIRDNVQAVDKVERCYWSQYSTQFWDARLDWDNQDMIDYLNNTIKPDPIITTLEDPAGYKHTVVIDPSRKPEKISDNEYKVFLYDPNCPSGGWRLPGRVHGVYSSDSYLIVETTGFKTWTYWKSDGTNKPMVLHNTSSCLSHHNINYFDVLQLSKKFFTSQKYTMRSQVLGCFSTNGEELSCSDKSGGSLVMENGKVTMQKGTIDYDPIMLNDGQNAKMVYFNSPEYSFSCDSGNMVFCNEETSYKMSADQSISVNVSKNGIELNAKDDDVNIQIQELHSGANRRVNSIDIQFILPKNRKLSVVNTDDNSVIVHGDYSGSMGVSFSDGDVDHKGQIDIRKSQSTTVRDTDFESTPSADHTHIWNECASTGESGESVDGLQTFICAVCGNTRYELIPVKNSITCNSVVASYSPKKQTIKLGAKVKGGAKLSYKSNNKKVKVDRNGKVILPAKFSGVAKIVIKATQTNFYAKTTKTVTVTVPTVTKVRKVVSGKKQAVVSWKKNTTGKGYKIQYSKDKKFKKNVRSIIIKKNKTNKILVKKLKKGTWYFRIRTLNGKNHSNWSALKKAKVK